VEGAVLDSGSRAFGELEYCLVDMVCRRKRLLEQTRCSDLGALFWSNRLRGLLHGTLELCLNSPLCGKQAVCDGALFPDQQERVNTYLRCSLSTCSHVILMSLCSVTALMLGPEEAFQGKEDCDMRCGLTEPLILEYLFRRVLCVASPSACLGDVLSQSAAQP